MSFNSVMSFVEILINKSFTFSVSDLTLLLSWFLSEGNILFFSEMILFMISTFIFYFLDQCLRLFVCGASIIII